MSTRTQYEADLAALKGSLARMSQLSADAVEDALEALCTADAEEAKGIVKGDTATTLAPNKKLTRAEFVTMITRIAGNISSEYTGAAGGSIVSGDTDLSVSNLTGDVIFSAPVHSVKLSDVSTPNRIVLKGCDNVTLTADGQAGMSTLAADPADSAAITFGDTVRRTTSRSPRATASSTCPAWTRPR